MRDINRISIILEQLKTIWELHADLRLGQLLLNVENDNTLYYIEDEALLEHLERFYDSQQVK